jgi:hypothetical protein
MVVIRISFEVTTQWIIRISVEGLGLSTGIQR